MGGGAIAESHTNTWQSAEDDVTPGDFLGVYSLPWSGKVQRGER